MARPPAFDPEVRVMLASTFRGLCWRCGGVGSDYAHRRPRGVRDEHTACFCNAAWLCRVDHAWCHKNPIAARDDGWVLSRYETEPWTVPVATIFGKVLLSCDGSVKHVK